MISARADAPQALDLLRRMLLLRRFDERLLTLQKEGLPRVLSDVGGIAAADLALAALLWSRLKANVEAR